MKIDFYCPIPDNPYQILDVDTEADHKVLRKAENKRTDETRNSNLSKEKRIEQEQKISRAYELLKKPASKAPLDFFVFNRNIGAGECEEIAKRTLEKPIDVTSVMQSTDDLLQSAPSPRAGDRPSQINLPVHEQLVDSNSTLEAESADSILEQIEFEI